MTEQLLPHDTEQAPSAPGTPHQVTRRTFLRAAVASAGALTVGSIAGPMVFGAQAAGGGGGTVTRYPLYIPQTASLTGTMLLAQAASLNLGGQTTTVWAYNSQFPGPTFVANRGNTASITLKNGLPEDTTIHWHGMIVPTDADGHPKDAVKPGGSKPYNFTINQRACLNWYHPHPHMDTGEQVYKGLAGAFIVRDAEEAALTLPSGAYELPLIIRDASFDSRGNFTFSAKSSGFFGNEPLVNGTRNPYLTVDNGWYRFRVLNGCTARVIRLALSTGGSFTLIGNDGGLVEAAVSMTQITLAPAERLDLLIKFSNLSRGSIVMLRDLDAKWDLLEFRGSGVAGASYTVPTALSSIPPLSGPTTPTRTFSFDGMTRINGQTYSLNRIDFRVPFGVVERWRFITNGNGPHPVHVHGASFQVKSRSGGRAQLFPWESGWKDTVLLNDGETVDVLIRFDQYRGLYLLHCHQLAHEDNGMMANFEVY